MRMNWNKIGGDSYTGAGKIRGTTPKLPGPSTGGTPAQPKVTSGKPSTIRSGMGLPGGSTAGMVPKPAAGGGRSATSSGGVTPAMRNTAFPGGVEPNAMKTYGKKLPPGVGGSSLASGRSGKPL